MERHVVEVEKLITDTSTVLLPGVAAIFNENLNNVRVKIGEIANILDGLRTRAFASSESRMQIMRHKSYQIFRADQIHLEMCSAETQVKETSNELNQLFLLVSVLVSMKGEVHQTSVTSE